MSGKVTHKSSDGSELKQRYEKRGTPVNCIAENIVFFHKDPLYIMLWQIIDDGVKDKQHRKNLLSDQYMFLGFRTDKHKHFGHVTVLDFAYDLIKTGDRNRL